MNGRRGQNRQWAAAGVGVLAAAMLLSACGGGNGNNKPPTSFTVHTLIVNATAAEIAVGYIGDGTPSDDQPVGSCLAELIDFPLVGDFVLTIDGQSAIDTAVDLPDGLPNGGESDLILEVNVAADGSISLGEDASHSSPDLALKPGRQYTKPATASICST